MHHDDVGLSAAERAAFAELIAALPADASVPNGPGGSEDGPARINGGLVGLTAVVTLVAGGLLAVAGTGFVAWCGMIAWVAGTVSALWSLVTNAVPPGWSPSSRP